MSEVAVRRFVLVNLVLQWVVLALAGPAMIRVIRTDGGTPAELVVYLLYIGAILLAAALLVTAIVAGSGRVAGERVARGGAVACEALILGGILAEIGTFLTLGVHPYGRATWAQVGTADIRHLPWWVFAGTVAGLGALVALEWGVLQLVSRLGGRTPRFPASGVNKRILLYGALGLAAFVAVDRSDAERLVPRGALPLYALWRTPARALPDLRPVRPIHDSVAAPVMARRPDIVFVQAESLRWDVLTPEAMPVTTAFAAQTGCRTAPRHYAGGHLTQYGTFALLYGLGAWAFLPYMQEQRPSWPLAVLEANGYQILGFDASGVLSYDIPPLVPAQFDRYVTRLQADSSIVDEVAHLVRQADGAPRFVFAFLYGTHAPYLYPAGFSAPGGASDAGQAGLHQRYLTSVAYLDHQLGRLFDAIAPRLRDGSAVLVVTGDHGEEFWEFGLLGHASVGFQDVRTRVPLVLCLPGTDEALPEPSEHAEVFPTVLAWAGVTDVPSGRMSGLPLAGSGDRAPVALAGAGFPSQAGAFALVTAERKFWLTLQDAAFRRVALIQTSDLQDRPLPPDTGVQSALRVALDRFRGQREAVLRPD